MTPVKIKFPFCHKTINKNINLMRFGDWKHKMVSRIIHVL